MSQARARGQRESKWKGLRSSVMRAAAARARTAERSRESRKIQFTEPLSTFHVLLQAFDIRFTRSCKL